MGGSGALGIGRRHGDVFAAIKANVPAEVKHASNRIYCPLICTRRPRRYAINSLKSWSVSCKPPSNRYSAIKG